MPVPAALDTLDVFGTHGALPIALAGAVLVVIAWGLGSLFGHGRRTALWVAMLTCLAVIGWLTIGLTVVTHTGGTGGVNLTPGQEIQRALETGAREPWLNLVGNIVLFIPFGTVAALLTRSGLVLRVLTGTALGFALSACIEATQYLLGRVADVDDIILNTSGAFLGALAAALVLALGAGDPSSRRGRGARSEA
ncbi:VanZ family protein [Demequina sp. SYSU T00192]|uniref:VanZ family protein n=1 Tax=Demequina litoralis TaxID=3051660 RepID=A0ABT8GB98_9MICO|nr:VanZ family protein [Demequina sp. SYSU T00192]MDN4476415.1 VanZ family protein [Demequina sp. SYSU T00192]